MTKILRRILIIGLCALSMTIFVGCKKDPTIEILQQFIIKQVDCKTYLDAKGNENLLKESFSTYFTEDTYQKYLDDVTGYMYPQLYYITNAKEVKIKSIVCNKVTPLQNDLKTYSFTINYQIIPQDIDGEKAKNIAMSDDTLITINAANKIQEVVILNTSDIIGDMFLDIKVQ